MDCERATMRIDVDEVLRLRAPGLHRIVPRFMIRRLEEYVCQDRLNDLLRRNADVVGTEFCRRVVADLGVTYDVKGTLPADGRRMVIVSNHPLGGLDGMVLASYVSRALGVGDGLKFIVNDLLGFVTPLRNIFVGVNKHGAQSRRASQRIDEVFASDEPVLMFPAGLVSRMGRDGVVADLRWHKMAVVKAVAHKRDIIPVRFDGRNSDKFYKFARRREGLGLKFNLEMLRLPAEVFGNEGARFRIHVGEPVAWQSLLAGRHAQAQADALRELVYSL